MCNKYNLCAIFFSIFFFFAALTGESSLYTIGDLEILEKENNFDEFLKHAHDIRPTNRDNHFKQMVRNVASEMIDFKINRKIFDLKTHKQIESLTHWPELVNDDLFLIKRNKYGLKYLKSCFTSQSTPKATTCLKLVHKFWNNTVQNPTTYDLGITLAELLSRHRPKMVDLWPFYESVVVSDVSEFYCKRDILQKTLIKKVFSRINTGNVNEKKLNKLLSSIANTECWKKITPQLKKTLFSDNREIQTKSYLVLRLRNELTPLEKSLYHTHYILEGPIISDTFNEAWATVLKLGEDYKTRSIVLSKLKEFDPLPGKLFSIYNKKKKRIMLRFLSRNFPEYLDSYAKTCIEYLSGTKTFPNGNPTLECRDLFKATSGTDWISTKIQNDYYALPKF